MKEFIKKAKEFVKKNYIACTVASAIILIIIASIIIVSLINMNKNKIEVTSRDLMLYQYFDKEKTQFNATLSYENDKLVNIKSDDYLIYENSPIYLQNETSIIVPKESSIVFYYRQNLSYRLPKYSFMILEESSSVVNSNGKEKVDTDFFIYDGENTYIFPVASTLKVNDTVVNLSNYSYVIAGVDYVTYYNYDSKTIEKIEGTITKASITINDMTIDLLKDVTVINSKVSLLSSNIKNMDIYLED